MRQPGGKGGLVDEIMTKRTQWDLLCYCPRAMSGKKGRWRERAVIVIVSRAGYFHVCTLGTYSHRLKHFSLLGKLGLCLQ